MPGNKNEWSARNTAAGKLDNLSDCSQIWAVNTSPQNRSGWQAGAAMPDSREVTPSREVVLISSFDTAGPKL